MSDLAALEVLRRLMAARPFEGVEPFDLRWSPPAWHELAACRSHPEVTFFPATGQPTAPAKALCAGCPVRQECLADALRDPHRAGVWGGTAPRERAALRAAAGNQPWPAAS